MRKALTLWTLAVLCFAVAFATTSGPNYAGTGALGTTGRDYTWSRPDRTTTSNNLYGTSSAVGADGATDDLNDTNYGFAIPTSATINGITLEIEAKTNNTGGAAIASYYLTKDGSATVGTSGITGVGLTTSDAFYTAGGASSLWGTTWTASEINATTFGSIGWYNVVDGSNVSVDAHRITIDYTEASGSKKKIVGFAGAHRWVN